MTQIQNQSALDSALKNQSELDALLSKQLGSVAIRPPNDAPGMVPENLHGLMRMARLYILSGLVPKGLLDGCQNPVERVCVLFQRGMELGLHPSQALDGMAVVNGRLTIWGDTAKALCYQRGLLEEDEERWEGSGDTRVAICRVRRRGQEKWHEERFSVGDARKAGLWGKSGPWSLYPDRMLMARARGFALRSKFPDALKGLAIEEEAADIAKPSPSLVVNADATAAINALKAASVTVPAVPEPESTEPLAPADVTSETPEPAPLADEQPETTPSNDPSQLVLAPPTPPAAIDKPRGRKI